MVVFLRRWPWLLPGLALLGLFLYMTGPGLGGTSDSVHYLWAARSWRATGQLLAPSGAPYRFWGPLYPLLLATFFSPAGVRMLHGAALLAQVALWGQLGRWLLPAGPAPWLPWLVALSTAVLVPAKFIWSETVFGALGAVYFFALLAWGRSGRRGWLGLATAAGFLLPLQRIAGFFLLVGAGVGLLVTGQWRAGRWRWLLGHWVGCAVGGLAWSYYAEVVAGPPLYQTARVWNALGSVADYGFVLARWFVPLAAGWRNLLPGLWAIFLPGILFVLWPRKSGPQGPENAPASTQSFTRHSLRLLWWVVLTVLAALLLATRATRAAIGPDSAERYCAALVGPVALLALARWPSADGGRLRWAGKARRWLGPVLLGGWLAYSAARAGHNAQQQRHRPPMVWPAAPSATRAVGALPGGRPDPGIAGWHPRASPQTTSCFMLPESRGVRIWNTIVGPSSG
ncbi:hypothetical protein [Hymenobacter sp.]|uniref:ArnT family glycosyltransferase n=1 Tax=Hymenobacter sp. TaxID=1898978 RepID=UPI00286CD5A8|nr:hypothetical protein [Hymenobacter sp.]